MSDTEITRTVQIEDKTVHIHIHLTREEVDHLLGPHLAAAFAREVSRQISWNPIHIVGPGSVAEGERFIRALQRREQEES